LSIEALNLRTLHATNKNTTSLTHIPKNHNSKMAAKPEDVTTAPADTAPAPSETQPEAAPKVEEKTAPQESTAAPTEALENLKLSEKKIDDGIPPAATTAAPTDTQTSPAASSTPTWPETPPDHPLTKLFALLPSIIDEASYSDVYGVTLSPTSPFHSKLILQKFLRANQGDLDKAKQQLLETLRWRREFDPKSAVDESFEKERFDGLGYVMEIEGVPESVNGNGKDVVTFNVYGAVKDNKVTFGDLEG
jgi:hypothetical protein